MWLTLLIRRSVSSKWRPYILGASPGTGTILMHTSWPWRPISTGLWLNSMLATRPISTNWWQKIFIIVYIHLFQIVPKSLVHLLDNTLMTFKNNQNMCQLFLQLKYLKCTRGIHSETWEKTWRQLNAHSTHHCFTCNIYMHAVYAYQTHKLFKMKQNCLTV